MHKPPKVNWGILGAGKIARKFAEDLAKVNGTNLFAVASRNKESARIFAQEYNAGHYYEGYETMLQNNSLDIVYIATPHPFHCEHTLLCIKYGKAVLCEKPFAMNLTEVETIVKAAREKNILVMEALWTAFLPHFQYTQDLLKEEKLGKVLKLEADFGFPANTDPSLRLFNKELGGGSLLDIGIYPVFAALATLGIPESINAQATFAETGVDKACDITFTYANEVTAELKSTFIEETPTTALFYCENGTILLNSRFHEPTNITLTDAEGNQETVEFPGNTNGYSYEIEHMNELVKSGKKESPVMSFNTSLQLIGLLDTIREKIGLTYS